MRSKLLVARVPLPLARRIDRLTRRLKRSHGWIANEALRAWVEREENRDRLTLEALSDVDAGRVVDHRSVHAWAESLAGKRPLPAPRLARGRNSRIIVQP